jgi:hypothetical protein
MRRVLWLLAFLTPLGLVSGCSGEKDRGIYKGEEKPVPPENKG